MARLNSSPGKSTSQYPRSLSINEWLEADRQAWDDACRPGSRLKPGGAANYLAQVSRDDFARRYGAFLGFLQRTGRLEPDAGAATQVILPNVEGYIADLSARVRSVTVWNCVYKLRRASQLLAPTVDFSWLTEIEKDLALVMEPRSKFDRLVFTERLVEAGLILVAESQEFANNDLGGTRDVRNGLMIALFALCPIRLKNFAALEIGQTFKHVQRKMVDHLAPRQHEISPGGRTSRPGISEPLHRSVPKRVSTRSTWVDAADKRALDLLHDGGTDDPRDIDLEGYS